MAMTIAVARTARPASCPPMRRVSSGRVADTFCPLERFKAFLVESPAGDGEIGPTGETVGNSPDESPIGEVSAPPGPSGRAGGDPDGIVPLAGLGSADADGGEVSAPPVPPGSGGGDPDGGVLLAGLGSGDADGGGVPLAGIRCRDADGGRAATTLIVAAEWKEWALLARAVAVSVIRSPEGAALRTKEPATSSSLWPVGKSPTVQTLPLGPGHTVNRGAPTCAVLPMAAVMLTPRASVTVLQTQIS
jgi:hypothetical protein